MKLRPETTVPQVRARSLGANLGAAASVQSLATKINQRQGFRPYCLNPIQASEITIEFPGLRVSYFTDVGSPSRHECKLIHCRR